ncbi:DUF2125 domain-containing protein [Sulfitobacter aestuarii]|uniref:DUF2125 domain-containing protein n=1 Tax=Sulfitobacter aestuarii TaxID=2161676 RepID=A0ABW5U3K5_9RHOB
MRRFVLFAAMLAALWSGWWWLVATGTERFLDQAAQTSAGEGWQLDFAGFEIGGYPLRLEGELAQPTLTAPARGLSVAADRLGLSAPAYWPGHVSLGLPETPISLQSPSGTARLELSDGHGVLRLRPGAALELQRLQLIVAAWRLENDLGELIAGDVLRGLAEQDAQDAATYHISMDAGELTPGAALRGLLDLPAEWPVTFDGFAAEMRATFDRPFDRHARADRLPQPRALDLARLEAIWGALRLSAAGQLSIDAEGIPTGALRLEVENWPMLLDLAQAAGLLQPRMRGQTEMMFRALANLGGEAEALDLTLHFADGEMALGPIRLGPAPRLLLR